MQPDEIYNLAAQSHVAVSFEEPEYTANSDGLGTLRILEAIRILGLEKKIALLPGLDVRALRPGPGDAAEGNDAVLSALPYAVAKLYAYWITVNYREAYGMYACNGILFNHESPLRGETFVTRKITRALARIKLGLQDCAVSRQSRCQARLGPCARLCRDAVADAAAGHSRRTIVIATGEQHSVRDFVNVAAEEVGIKIRWEGKGVDEKGYNAETGAMHRRDRSAVFPADRSRDPAR